MMGGLKKKIIFGALAVADTVLLGTVVTLVHRVINGKAHETVADAIIKENTIHAGKRGAESIEAGRDACGTDVV